MKNRTVKSDIQLSGVSIHSGKMVNISIKPANNQTGLKFVRTDLSKTIFVSPQNLINSHRATILSQDDVCVKTPEHLLAALHIFGINNAIIEIDQDEIPIMDGSALDFVNGIQLVGTQDLEGDQHLLEIEAPNIVSNIDQNISLLALPDDVFKITFLLEYPDTFIGTQSFSATIDRHLFIHEIAPARTYGFYAEVKALYDKGLAQGGSLENAVVIGEDSYMNDLRFPDELIRHKVLDLIGDLAILNRPIKGHFVGIRSGHALNATLVKKLL